MYQFYCLTQVDIRASSAQGLLTFYDCSGLLSLPLDTGSGADSHTTTAPDPMEVREKSKVLWICNSVYSVVVALKLRM